MAITVAAAKVLGEMAFAVAQGMNDVRMADSKRRKFVLDAAARDFWLAGHTKSVPKTLRAKGRDWAIDRAGVLPMATLLGRRAATLAYAAAGTSTLVHVKLEHVEKASKTVRENRRCAAFAAPGLGGGRYCEF